jgi:hypothetical protein
MALILPASFDTASLLLPRPSTINSVHLRDLPTAVPEMSDIWSLACIYLDIITFMLKGKNNEFVKFRTTRRRVLPHQHQQTQQQQTQTRSRTRTDTSFHNEPDKISAWISLLDDESTKHPEQIYRGVPELLRLVRTMMSQNATLRPSAREVRDRLQMILEGECGVEHLCCAGREWKEFDKGDLKDVNTSLSASSASARRGGGSGGSGGRHDSPLRDDDLSVSMGGILNAAATTVVDDAPRKGSDAGTRRTTTTTGMDNKRRGTAAAGHDEEAGVAKKKTDATTDADAMDAQRRRRSSASTVTAKVSSWKMKIFSGGRGGITA